MPRAISARKALDISQVKKISIIATLYFDVIVGRVMALSLERRNLFFPAK
jgi:hypothetical protein